MQLQNLTTKFIGRDFQYFEELDSTQLEVLRQIENKKIKDGSLILTKLQTNGIGTHGRRWFTENERKYYIFIICRN